MPRLSAGAKSERSTKRLRLGGEADFLEPGHRNRPGDVLVGELPVMQAVLAGVPREISAAIVDDGWEADAALLIVQEDEAKVAQLDHRILQGRIEPSPLILDLVT